MVLNRIKRSYLPHVSNGIVAAGLFFAFIMMCLVFSITGTVRMHVTCIVQGLPPAGTLIGERKSPDKSDTFDKRSIPQGGLPSIIARSHLPVGIRVARAVPTPIPHVQIQNVISTDLAPDTHLAVEELSANITPGFWDGDSAALFTNLNGYGTGDDWGLPTSGNKLFGTDFDWVKRLKYPEEKEIYHPEDCRPRIEFARLHFPPEQWIQEYKQDHYNDTAYAIFSFTFTNDGLRTWEFHEVFPGPKEELWSFDYAVERMLISSAYRIPSCWGDTVVVMKNCRWDFCYGCEPLLTSENTIVIVSKMR